MASPGPITIDVEGETVTAVYLDGEFNPVTPDKATLLKLIYKDGSSRFLAPSGDNPVTKETAKPQRYRPKTRA